MAKPKIPNQRKANLEHKKRIERYAALIQQVYDRVAHEAARNAVLAGADPDKEFSFADYPITKEAIKKLQSQLLMEVSAIIMRGTSEEWKESNLVQDMVARKVLTAYTGTTKHGDEYSRYFETNPDSLRAFQERKDRGMNLSTRVWDLSEQYKRELEESITAAIAPGTSAVQLAAQVKQYLREPDKRFRRIKEKMADGTIRWHLSKPAKAYNPGRGVYRSSARNAQRLARTEINMAYRTAEQKRWEQFDFVVGFEVKTTQNGHHVEDICDTLAGKYPKSFKFTGWHPQCMCYCIPILKTEDEFWADDDVKSVNEVTDVPQGFKDWIRDNKDRINTTEKRGKLPYFIRDNRDDVEYILHHESRKKTPLENAAERHAARTADEVLKIQTIWNRRKEYLSYQQNQNYSEVSFNYDNGGLKALHRQHNIDSDKGWYETFVQDIGYRNGHKVILESETGKGIGKSYTEGTWDNLQFELSTKETGTPNNILRGLKHCSSKEDAQMAVVFLPNTKYNENDFNRALSRYFGLIKKGMPFKSFKRIICISEDKIVFDKEY